MSYNLCSGNFSSRSLRGCLPTSGSSCGSSYPSNLVYRTDSCSSDTCQLGSSLYSGCQDTCGEPTNCQRSCVVSRPCQTSWYYPRTFTTCNPCQTTYNGSLGFGCNSCHNLGYGSRSCYSVECGSSGFRPLTYGNCGFPSFNYRSGINFPTYLAPRVCQSSCYRPVQGSVPCGFNC